MQIKDHVELLCPLSSVALSVFSVTEIHLHTDNFITFCLFFIYLTFNTEGLAQQY